MIRQLGAFVRFLYGFVVGDDPWVAAGVVVALVATRVLAGATSTPVWWIPVVAVMILLPISIRRVTKTHS
jgi:hypothetical protein